MGIFNVDLDKINVDDVDFNKDETGSRIYVRLTAWRNRFKQTKAFKKYISRELMLGAWRSVPSQSCSQQASQPTSQPASHPASQPASQSVSQSVSEK